MTVPRLPAVLVLVAVSTSPVRADLFDDVTALCRDAKFIVVGRVTRVHSSGRPNDLPGVGTRATATLEVSRYLKGASDAKSLDIEYRAAAWLDFKPDTDDVIWIVSGERVGGRYLVKKWKWDTGSTDLFLKALNRIDKTTRIEGMPKPTPDGKPLSIVLAIDDGTGKATTSGRVTSETWRAFLVQFENHEVVAQSVMPCMYGSQLGKQFPHYDLELLDANGKSVPRRRGIWCSSVAAVAPRDIVPLARGEVFRESVPLSRYGGLEFGKYQVRLRYTARRDVRIDGVPWVENPATTAALKSLWEGELVSNWFPFEYVAPGAMKP
jgi:hypothetical protein